MDKLKTFSTLLIYIYIYIQKKNIKIKNRNKNIYITRAWNEAKVIPLILGPPRLLIFLFCEFS